MEGKISIFILMLLIFVVSVGMYIAVDSKVKVLEYELEQQQIIHDKELEEIKKSQRITAQDVDFLEKLVIEGSER